MGLNLPFFSSCSRKRLLFLSSAFVPETDHRDTLDFFSLLTAKLTDALGSFYDIVLRVPKDNKSSSQQAQFLNMAIVHKNCYDAIIIAPIETHVLKGPLSAFMRSNPKYPVFTIDKNFEHYIDDFEDGKIPPSVTVDGLKGGLLAGKALRDYCASLNNGNPRVRVLQGLEGAEPRVEGFLREFKDFPNAVKLHKSLSFDTPSAKLRIQTDLAAKDFCDAYFCTNDEMALGVREALVAYERDGGGWPSGRPPVIIGFDGIGVVKSLIASGDKHIYGTIDVRIEEQVFKLADMVSQLFDNGKPFDKFDNPSKRNPVVEPRLISQSP